MARQLLARAGTGKGPLHVNQSRQCLLVRVEPIGLKQHITIPYQFKPFKGFQNGINGTDGTDGTDGTYSYADKYSYGSSASNMGAFRWYSTSGTGQGDAVRLEIALNGEVAGNLTDTSDGRLKENIEKIADGALSTIKELNPVKFAWKDTKVVNSGFVAQDVEKIIPEVMGGSEERKTIHTSGILAYAVKAIQELTEKVETQEKELAHLKG
mgnify:CR=1 FL=1